MLPRRFIHVDGEKTEGTARALRPERTDSATFTGPDVSIGAVPHVAPAIVEWLTGGTDVAIVFRLVAEMLRTKKRAVLAVDAVASTHIRRNTPPRQPLQELAVAIGRVGGQRFGRSSLPPGETSQHILRSHALLTHACRRRLHAHNHATVVVYQIVVVVAEPRRHAALSGIGGIRIGRRHLILLMHRFFHRVLLFHFLEVLAHSLMHLSRFHRLMLALDQPHFHALSYDLFKQLLEQPRLLKPSVPVLGERRMVGNLLIEP